MVNRESPGSGIRQYELCSRGQGDKSLPSCGSVAYVYIMMGLARMILESLLSADLKLYSLDRKITDESAHRLEELSHAQPCRSAQIVPSRTPKVHFY